MRGLPAKLILVGVDGAIPDLIIRLVEEGKLPNMAKLMKEGVYGELLAPYPTVTPNNWTSLVTGAWAGTTGITDYHVHHPGEPLDVIYSGFNTKECVAEYLWDAAERVGKKVILMKYSASWPPTIKKGIQVNGCGPNWTDEVHEICGENLFTTERGYPLATLIEFKPLDERGTLVAKLTFTPRSRRIGRERLLNLPVKSLLDQVGVKPALLYAILPQSKGVYEELVISRSPSPTDSLTKLHVGEWSNWVKLEFTADEGVIEGLVRFKLLELSEDAKSFRLYATHVMPLRGWTYPESIGPELVERFGGFVERPGWDGRTRGWIDDETFIELVDYQNEWMARASKYLMKKYGWDLFFLQTHGPDYAHHLYINEADPLTNSDEESRRYFARMLERVYESVDRLIGELMEVADEKTLFVVVSDHGATPHVASVDVWKILEEAGLLSLKRDEAGRWTIDWSRTKAVPQRNCYIYVNLKGRDPHGIVEPEEYDKVRDQVIDVLLDYRDSKTGKRPFYMVLKKEDARILGLYGDRIGDIVYVLRPGFGHAHGQQLPTAKFGDFGSMASFIVISGPGIRKGAKIKPTRWLIDVAPTVAYLLGIPVPKDSDGSIMYEILEDPDAMLNEVRRLKEEVERWKNAYEKMSELIHIA